jgi:hypothetical protein
VFATEDGGTKASEMVADSTKTTTETSITTSVDTFGADFNVVMFETKYNFSAELVYVS